MTKNATGKDLPDGLIGIQFDDDRGFVCAGCIKDDEDIDDESKCTSIFKTDGWFDGEICARCNTLVGEKA
jgi:hypothetical protein